MAVIIGSARLGENGSITGGKVGDQTGREVGTQTFYVHAKGWYVLRPKSAEIANKMAQAMKRACDNDNIGYDQNNRLDVLKYGTGSTVKTECDCSSLVRLCIKEASGKDVGNFNTANEVAVLEESGLFEPKKKYSSRMTLYDGDVLVTCTKGHTVIVVDGESRKSSSGASEGFTGGFPTLPSRGYFKIGDGYQRLRNYDASIRKIQSFLKWYGCSISVDGDYGPKTAECVKKFQRSVGLSADGLYGSRTLAKAKAYRK